MPPLAGLIRPILPPYRSVNQTYPSGLAVIASGPLAAVGTAYSVTTPVLVIRATLLAVRSVNETLPAAAVVIPDGTDLSVGTENSVMLKVGPAKVAPEGSANSDGPAPIAKQIDAARKKPRERQSGVRIS